MTAGGGWDDPVVGGTVLRIPAIQSPNFSLASQTGWAILQDGQAYFFEVTVNGNVIISAAAGEGLFIYSGPPTFGNLIYSAVAETGDDPFGNTVLGGETSYNGSGVINIDGGVLQIYPT